jgi:hypothetical protein
VGRVHGGRQERGRGRRRPRVHRRLSVRPFQGHDHVAERRQHAVRWHDAGHHSRYHRAARWDHRRRRRSGFEPERQHWLAVGYHCSRRDHAARDDAARDDPARDHAVGSCWNDWNDAARDDAACDHAVGSCWNDWNDAARDDPARDHAARAELVSSGRDHAAGSERICTEYDGAKCFGTGHDSGHAARAQYLGSGDDHAARYDTVGPGGYDPAARYDPVDSGRHDRASRPGPGSRSGSLAGTGCHRRTAHNLARPGHYTVGPCPDDVGG